MIVMSWLQVEGTGGKGDLSLWLVIVKMLLVSLVVQPRRSYDADQGLYSCRN